MNIQQEFTASNYDNYNQMMHINDNTIDLNYWSVVVTDYILQPSLMIILCLLSIFVVLGNLLVVTAIWHETQLHSVTNYLIASLAAADCLVGAVVMPFSVISEIIIGSWTFGATWCDMWHSFDVLASTASINNLCAISLDRYLAITNPISYPRKMTPKRVALLIVSLWTCSALISFPAILWWRAVGSGPLQRLPQPLTTISPLEVSSSSLTFTSNIDTEPSQYRCVFTDDTYYLLFSSIVSFYGPLCVMLYAYYRIYKAAVQQTRFLKHGSKQVMIGRNKKLKRLRNVSEHSMSTHDKYGISEGMADSTSNMEGYDRQHLVLRAHRGGGGNNTNQSKMVNGDTNSAPKVMTDQKKRETNNCDLVSSKNEVIQNKLIDTIHSNEPPSADRTNYRNLRANPNFDIKSSIRDKLRVNHHRFDLESRDKTAFYLKNEKNCQSTSCEGPERCKDPIDAPRIIPKLNEKVIDQITCNNRGKFPRRDKQYVAKPLLASIGNRSTSVDVTIMEHSSPLDMHNQIFSGRNETKSRRDSNHIVEEDRMEMFGRKDACPSDIDDGGSDDMFESESFSASSDSYGTGSIASVLVRPQSTQRSSMERTNIEKNCDIIDGPYTSSPRLRRAMSFENSTQKDRDQWKNIDVAMKEHTYLVVPNSTTGNSLFSRKAADQNEPNQDSSFYTKSSDIIVSFKTVKTLDIRSWMKLKKASRQPKCAIGNVIDNRHMLPPPSLVPLMMMNSDTSTDSSVAPAGDTNVEESKARHGVKKSDRAKSVEIAVRVNESHHVPINHVGDSKRDVRTTDRLEESKQADRQDKESGLQDDLKRGEKNDKCQMVYYDSDKLIQSIVDITAIRYIDCANQVEREDDITRGREMATGFHKPSKLQSGSVDQRRIQDSERVNLPRQNRTVGKKLSKLAKERKAAKTLGIVVGVFILCWLPFFVANIIVALCGIDCIFKPQILLPIVTWLGWLNSAMNPVIYACWSRDFRRAFRRVLCAWVEFICPYNNSRLAKMLRLKKTSNYSTHDAHLTRTYSSTKASSTTRSGMSIEGRAYGPANGGVARNLLADQ